MPSCGTQPPQRTEYAAAAENRVGGRRKVRSKAEGGVPRVGEVDVESPERPRGGVRAELEERIGSSGGRHVRAVQIGRQHGDRARVVVGRVGERHERRRIAVEHRGAVERPRLSAEEGRPCRVEDVRRHVVRVGPRRDLRVVVEVRPEVEVVAVPRPRGIVGGRDRNALVRRVAGSRELRDQPAVRGLVVESDRVTRAALAHSAEARPHRVDRGGAEDGGAGGLVEDLEGAVHDLDVLRVADLAVRVGRSASAEGVRRAHAVEVERRRRHVIREAPRLQSRIGLGR